MFRKSKANEIESFFAQPLQSAHLSVFYLGVSGYLVRSAKHAVIFDPAAFLKSDEVKSLKTVDALLFTHDHLDHFKADAAEGLFKATGAMVLAETKVADKLKGKISAGKLVTAESEKTYNFGGVKINAVQGIHRGPIMLYQIEMDAVTLFHGGDSGYVTLANYSSDVAILPTGRMSPTASPENAYKMAVDIKPQVIFAMHGSQKQKQRLQQKIKEGMPQTKVLIMEPYTMQTVTVQIKA
jgi:L-ascorbate metabolism protein UlaG (beta-lactamase superfamily)